MKGQRAIRCIYCQGGFDTKADKVVENRAEITVWKPSEGMDPLLRQFKCKNCGKMTYKLVSTQPLAPVGEETE